MDAESKWLKGREKHYLKHQDNCPICNSENLDSVGQMQHDRTGMSQYIICEDCGAEWLDQYRLHGVIIGSYPTDRVPRDLEDSNPNEAFKR